MRTTIELTDAQRARLLQLAASRGEKGFSRIVQEAVDLYLEGLGRRGEAVQKALALRGRLPDAEADELQDRVTALRAEWR